MAMVTMALRVASSVREAPSQRGGAYEAATRDGGSFPDSPRELVGSAGNDDGGLDEGGGPAAIIMCQVLADPSAAAG